MFRQLYPAETPCGTPPDYTVSMTDVAAGPGNTIEGSVREYNCPLSYGLRYNLNGTPHRVCVNDSWSEIINPCEGRLLIIHWTLSSLYFSILSSHSTISHFSILSNHSTISLYFSILSSHSTISSS